MSGDEVQALGRQMVLGLHMLARSVRIYSTDNAIFLKPLQTLLEQVNRIVALEGKLDLSLVGPSLYINSRLVRIEQAALENLKQLAQAFQAHGIGGFILPGPTSLEELRNFFRVFAADLKGEPLPADGLPSHRLEQMRLRPWATLHERVDDGTESPEQLLKRRTLAIYARTLLWVDHQLKRIREGRPDETSGASTRIAQDLVEVTCELKGELLPLLVNGEGDRALTHHLVNTAVLAVDLGATLGLARVPLKDLAVAALHNEMLLARLPPQTWLPADPDKLAPVDQSQRAMAWQVAARMALSRGGGSRLNQVRALSGVEMHEPYQAPGAAGQGRAQADFLFVSRVLAIVSHFDALTSPAPDRPALSPDQALAMMWGPQRHRFDPELLWVFLRTMARRPIKVVPRAVGGVYDLPAPGAAGPAPG